MDKATQTMIENLYKKQAKHWNNGSALLRGKTLPNMEK